MIGPEIYTHTDTGVPFAFKIDEADNSWVGEDVRVTLNDQTTQHVVVEIEPFEDEWLVRLSDPVEISDPVEMI